MRTICYGELMIDLIADGHDTLQNAALFRKHAGGAAANVAAQLAKLGDQACMLGKLGRDAFGAFLLDYLRQYHIDTDAMILDPIRRTTAAFVGLDARGVPDYLFYRAGGASESLDKGEIDVQKLDGADVIYTSSLMLTSEKVRETTLWLLDYGRRRGIRIAFDMNYRATAWESEALARTAISRALEYVQILKINEEELRFLLGQNAEIAAAAALPERYPSLEILIVTCGARGAYLFQRNAPVLKIEARAVPVADTTGAGDSFMGAFLFAYGRCGMDAGRMREIGEFAARVSELTIQGAGAIDAMPDLDTYRRLIGDII